MTEDLWQQITVLDTGQDKQEVYQDSRAHKK